MHNEIALSCGVVIVDANNRVLLGHNTNGDYWGFPKGRQDPNETEIETAIREVKEETGFDLTGKKLVKLSSNAVYKDGVKHISLFMCRVDSVDTSALTCTSVIPHLGYVEMDAFEMVSLDDLRSYLSPRMYKYVITNNIIEGIINA